MPGMVDGLDLVVVIDELDLAAEQAALGVDFLRPDLGAEQRLLAVGGKRAGQRHAEADLDRLGALRGGRQMSGGQTGCQQNSAGSDNGAAAREAETHVFLQRRRFSLTHPDVPPGTGSDAAVSRAENALVLELWKGIRSVARLPGHRDS